MDTEEFIDPRAAFCEGEVGKVWTSNRRDADIYKVKVDQDRYQLLLDELPPERSTLFHADHLRSLCFAVGALRLRKRRCTTIRTSAAVEDPQHAREMALAVHPQTVTTWYSLTDETQVAQNEQRRFVEKRWVCFLIWGILEGPPRIGKDHPRSAKLYGSLSFRESGCCCVHLPMSQSTTYSLEQLIESGVPIDAVSDWQSSTK